MYNLYNVHINCYQLMGLTSQFFKNFINCQRIVLCQYAEYFLLIDVQAINGGILGRYQ